MSSLKLLCSSGFCKNVRYFGSTKILKDVKTSSNPSSSVGSGNVPKADVMRPNGFEKLLLVLCRSYPSMNQVPERVSNDIIQKATSKFRIVLANIMMAVTLYACYQTVSAGKRRKEIYISENYVEDPSVAYRKQISEEFKQSILAESAAKKS